MFDIILLLLSVCCLVRNKVAPVLLMILCLFYSNNIIGEVTSPWPFLHNNSDTGVLVYVLLLLYLAGRSRSEAVDENLVWLRKGVVAFYLFLFLSYVIDLSVNYVAFSSIVKSFRNWSCLLLVFFIPKLRVIEIQRFFRYVFLFTMILTALFIVEFIFDISITGVRRTEEGSRASGPWPFSLFVWGALFSGVYKISSAKRIFCIVLILFHLIICGSRSNFMAFALVALIVFFLSGAFSMKKLLAAVLAVSLIGIIFSTENVLSRRFAESKEDVASVRAGSGYVEGNFSFRILLLDERMQYINQKAQYAIFGIGNVQERDFKKNVFKIGLLNDDNDVTQLDTGDIAWALLFLRLGYVGTFVYLLFIYGRMMAIGFRNKENPLALALLTFLCAHLFFLSFTGYLISTSYFLLPLLCSVPLQRNQRQLI